MGRKKKNQKEEEIEQENKDWQWDIKGDVKKSIVAVFLLSLSIIVILGFFQKAGLVGEKINFGIGVSVGWLKWIFPLFLIGAAIILLIKGKTSFYVSKIVGLFFVLFSAASFFHWFYIFEDMSSRARAGMGGGYLGYFGAHFFSKYLGSAGGLVLILAILIVSLIFTFNFSLIEWINKMLKKRELDKDGDEMSMEETIDKEIENEDEEEKEEMADEKGNIAKLEFVEGPDQYVDEKISNQANKSEFSAQGKEIKLKKTAKKSFSSKDDWELPPLELLEKSSGEAKGGDVENNAQIIQKTLKNFGIDVEIGEIKTGPAVTQYSFRPAVGVKISKILSLQNDIALSLAAHPIRIEAPIPGKSLIGIEVPNKVSTMVRLRDIFESQNFSDRKTNLTISLGEDVSGNFELAGIDKMPHLLIAGATGTGKSVCVNSIITSLLFQNSPRDLRFIMVDPKRVELSLYNGIPHLLSDVVVENGKVVNALRWAVGEMERRYRLFQDTGSRDINSYNEKLNGGKKLKYTNPETGETEEKDLEHLPYIVIVIDELADLMSSHGKEVEGAIVRIAQMARAVGIHLIVSTQRPSVEVITGLIKANITTRIAFQVASQIDSRTILDMAGAEKLLGNGDMLYLSASSPKPRRIQGVFVSESEVKRVVKFIKEQKFEEEIGEEIVENTNNESSFQPSKEIKIDFSNSDDVGEDEELLQMAIVEVKRAKKASASLLQRRLRIGYARAARVLDILEDQGIVGPSDGAKPREVYNLTENENKIDYDDSLEDQKKRDKWEM